MAIKRGDKVAVITRSLCRYEGTYFSVNVDKQTFTLCNVRAFGTENRDAYEHFPASQDIYECVEFKGSDVQDVRIINFHDLRDPAIVNVGERCRDDSYESPFQYLRDSLRETGNRAKIFSQRSRLYGNGIQHKYFRNDWMSAGSRGDGSFPRINPGALGNTLEEFDFEKGIEEFSRLRLNDSIENFDSAEFSSDGYCEKKSLSASCFYDRQKSFFDNLSGGSSIVTGKQQHRSRLNNPNIETFGLDTVQQLHEIRKYTNDSRIGYRNRTGFRRNNNRNSDSFDFLDSRDRSVRKDIF